jgi:hypothetical protein
VRPAEHTLETLTLKRKIDTARLFRLARVNHRSATAKQGTHLLRRDRGDPEYFTPKHTASSTDLYQIRDNLLGHLFCVKVFLLLLYRLRTNGVPCSNFTVWNESSPRIPS